MINVRIIDESDFGRDKPALRVGTVVTVLAQGYDVTSRNDVGGTLKAPPGRYTVRIVREWWDYETGQHYAGMFTAQSDVAKLVAAARTPYGPKKKIDHTVVCFMDTAIVEVVKKR